MVSFHFVSIVRLKKSPKKDPDRMCTNDLLQWRNKQIQETVVPIRMTV